MDPVGSAENLRPLRRVAQSEGAFDRRQWNRLAAQRSEKRDAGQRTSDEGWLTERIRELEGASRLDSGRSYPRVM